MMWYLLDTNHAGLVLRDSEAVLERFLARVMGEDRFAVSMPTVAELWYMVYPSAQVDVNAIRLRQMLSVLPVVEFDSAAAEDFGRIHAELRRIGKPIPIADMQIAAIARTRGMTVATADQHFNVVPHVATVNLLA